MTGAPTMWHRATIFSRRQLSPDVIGLTLNVDHPHDSDGSNGSSFAFLPGQWVDFKPRPSSSWKPHEDGRGRVVGGYSLTSVPRSLPRIELAIQRSNHPVANWATDRARPSDVVDVRVGGSFTYESGNGSGGVVDDDDADDIEEKSEEGEHSLQAVSTPTKRLLFVAGGVGINPLFSMIRQWHFDQTNRRGDENSRAVLLYSGGAREKLLFVDQLKELVDEKPDHFNVVFANTQGHQLLDESRGSEGKVESGMVFRRGRIDLEMIRGAVNWLNRSRTDDVIETPSRGESKHVQEKEMIADDVFVCGPPGMPESMTKILSEEKLVRSADDVHFEKWW